MNKMSDCKRLAGMFLIAALSLAGCQREEYTTAGSVAMEGETAENAAEQDTLTRFHTLLQKESETEPLYKFLSEHIAGVTRQDADFMISELIGFEVYFKEADFARLMELTAYCSDDMRQFIELMDAEQQNPYRNEEGRLIPLEELLSRAAAFERQFVENQGGFTYRYSYDMYVELLQACIAGDYEPGRQLKRGYMEEAEERIREDIFKIYADFAEREQDTKTGEILKEYAAVLYENNRYVNDAVIEFYDNLPLLIQERMNYYIC